MIRGGYSDGGFYVVDEAKLVIQGGSVSGNKSSDNGGGISLVDGNLTLKGENTITGNTASIYGGGIYVDHEANNIYVQDKLVVTDNNGSNIYLDDEKLTVSAAFTAGALMSITFKDKETEVGVFTKNFSSKNGDASPTDFFLSDDDYEIYLDGSEAAMRYVPEEDNPFVSMYDNIRDPKKATGKNWMASISGERYIYEINLPRAHDASMNKVDSEMHSAKVDNYLSMVGAGGCLLGGVCFVFAMALPGINIAVGAVSLVLSIALLGVGISGIAGVIMFEQKCTANAKTQYRYLDEQMEDGVREFDMRLNPNKNGTGSGKDGDDGENLSLCHGRNEKAGS